MKLLRFIRVIIIKTYYFAHDFIQISLAKIGQKFPKTILLLVPDQVLNSFLENDLSTHHINNYLKTLSISAKSELYNLLNDSEKERYCREQWRSWKGPDWFEKDLRDNDIKDLISKRKKILDFLDEFIEQNKSFKIICEIGAGDGRFLLFLENRFYSINKFIGVDLNEEFINRNRKYYQNYEKIIFEPGQISEIFPKIINLCEHSSLLLVAVRTLTWFTQTEIESLLLLIKNSEKEIVLALSEQNQMDLQKEFKSFIRGDIFFHSHNYPFLIKKAGLRILKSHIQFNNKLSNDHAITILLSNR